MIGCSRHDRGRNGFRLLALGSRPHSAAASEPGSAEGLESEAEGRRVMDTLRVLVVDDETGMRLAIARVLGTFTVKPGDDDATKS